MGVTFVDLVLIGEVVFLCLFCNAGLKCAFNGVAAQVVSAGKGGGGEEDFRLSEPKVCELLKVGSVHSPKKGLNYCQV